jgi:RHS repeat-associated protein
MKILSRRHIVPTRSIIVKAHHSPLWSHCTASVLIVLQLFAFSGGQAILAAPLPTTSSIFPEPVHTQALKIHSQHIHLIKTKPDFGLHLPSNPTDQDLSGVLISEEPLVLIGNPTTPSEDQDLVDALTAYSRTRDKENVVALTSFLRSYPQSGWKASILTNLGLIYRKYGYYSRALGAWDEAWQLSKAAKGLTAHQVADRAVSELAKLLSSLGRAEALKPLLIEVNSRPVYGQSATTLLNAKEGLAVMNKDPGIAFKCGPFALGSIELELNPNQPINSAVLKAKSTAKGFSLDQLVTLSRVMKLNYQPAKRQTGASIIVPSVVHWKSGHYAAILKQVGASYLVKDPTFQGETLLSKTALDDEASGYFLIPQGTLSEGWTTVDSGEAKTVFGRGYYGPRAPGCTKCQDPSAGGSCTGCGESGSDSGSEIGMAAPSIKLLLACLHLGDTPEGYSPPVGPEVRFSVGYNQYEASHAGSFVFSNFGNDWVSNWIGYVKSAPITAPASSGYAYNPFEIALPSGGYETYESGFNAYTSTGTNAGYFRMQTQGNAVLDIMPSTENSDQLRYERHMPDGSMQVFDSIADSQGNIFLTQVIDPYGNSVTLGYDTTTVSGTVCIRLRTITDTIGQTTNINYGLSGDSLKITQVTDPFGRSAFFSYTSSAPYQLLGITDVVGMTSQFTYSPGTDNITALTTPYGTTTFNATTENDPLGADPNADRTIVITDPNGGQEKAFARFEPDQFEGPPTETLPNPSTYGFTAIVSEDLDYGLEHFNTYYWDKEAMLVAPNDLTQAHVYHWLLDSDQNGPGGVLYSEKKALESRIWYNYDQSYGFAYPGYLGTNDQPTGVLRLLDDGTPQYSQYSYNSVGNKTESIDPLGRTLTYDYASNNIDLVDIRQTAGSNNDALLQIGYNTSSPSWPAHCPQYIWDASGQETSLTYNTQGQLTSVTNPKSEVTSYTYTGLNGTGTGNYLTSIVGPAASSVTGDSVSCTYDAFGRINKITDSQGNLRIYDYDALNRVTLISYPDGTSEQFNYNKLDLEWHKDRLGRWTHNVYDAMRHLVSSTDPLGRTTAYQWCKCGALTGFVDGDGNTTTLNRDVQARLISKVYAGGLQDQYIYENTTSRLASIIDAKGQKIDYSYNGDDTLSQINYTRAQRSTPSVALTYDPTYRRITGMTDGTGATSYYYTNFLPFSSFPPTSPTTGAGRLSGESGPLSGGNSGSPGISYNYDQLGRPLGWAVNDSGSTGSSLAYDSLGRVQTVTNNLGTFTHSFLGTTPLISSVVYPSSTGVSQNNAYYTTSSPQDIERLQEIKYTNSSGVISKHDYGYDADGEITSWQQQVDSSSPNGYTNSYDAASQLSEALLTNSSSATVHRYAYEYDPAGNRTSNQVDLNVTSGSYNNLNQLQSTTGGGPLRVSGSVNQNSTVTLNGNPTTQASPTQFSGSVATSSGTNVVTVVAQDTSGLATTNQYQVVTSPGTTESVGYDLNGNETSDANHTYEWDAANRLTAINYPSSGNRTEFTYDGYGRRVKIVEKSSSGSVTSTKQCVFVGAKMVEERNAGGTVTKQYFPEGMTILSGYSTTGSFYYTRDHLGSVRELLSSTGTVVSRLNYDPYGRTTLVSGTNLSDFQYAGYYEHATSGLNLTMFRAYDPNTARWLSRDPIGEKGGINLYGYVGNDPTNFIDPLGLFSCQEICAEMAKVESGKGPLRKLMNDGDIKDYSKHAREAANPLQGGQTPMDNYMEWGTAEAWANAGGFAVAWAGSVYINGLGGAITGDPGWGNVYTSWAQQEFARSQMQTRILKDMAKAQGCDCSKCNK